MQMSYYLKKLKEDFSRRKRDNYAYSLRAFGRDLGVHPSTLSQVLLGKRPLPLKNAERVVDRLNLNGRERTLFNESLGKRHLALDGIKVPENDERFLLDETYFQIIAEWEHYAVLTLFDCQGFKPSAEQIALRLNIENTRAEVVIDNLLKYELLKRTQNGLLELSHSKVRTTEDVASQALRSSHREALELGRKKLNEEPVHRRDFSSIMLAVDPEKIPEAKIIIREFRQKMAELMKPGKKSEVYQMAIQFYPLTVDQGKSKFKQSKKVGGKHDKIK